jgi:hypothetical protein
MAEPATRVPLQRDLSSRNTLTATEALTLRTCKLCPLDLKDTTHGISEVTLRGVRCPYCIMGDEFKPMVAHLDGRSICARCGHLAVSGDKNFKCSCEKCLEWRRTLVRMQASTGSDARG